MATNDFVPFCNENTGTNLPSQASYLANPALPIGNQPGIASSSLNNKAIRQATTIASIVSQFTSTQTGADMLDTQNTADHAIPAALLAALTAALKNHSPVVTSYLTGSGNHNLTYKFQIATGNATAAATYSDGTTTYTVKTTVASGTQLDASGNANPTTVGGTLTKLTGAGDATITFYAYRKAIYLRIRMVGGGGGGAGGGTANAGGNGGDGGNTTFGTTLLVANGGKGCSYRANTSVAGGTASLGTGPVGVALSGSWGSGTGESAVVNQSFLPGGMGGVSAFGGGGTGNFASSSAGSDGATNSGSGGGGGSMNTTTAANFSGGGGGAGGYVDATITTPLSVYAYAIGAAGTAGSSGTNGSGGGAGGSGVIIVEEHYQ